MSRKLSGVVLVLVNDYNGIMKKTVIALIIGLVIGFILAQVISPHCQVVSSGQPMGRGSTKMNRWMGKTWILAYRSWIEIPSNENK